jgi:hypothetical protein
LSKAPAVEPTVYYRWFLADSDKKARAKLNAPPMSNTAAGALLKSTKYDDPASIFNITAAIGSSPSIAPLPLGNFSVDSKQTYCFLFFRDNLLPRDFPYDETRADTGLTQVKATPDTKALPRFFLQLGQLYLGPSSAAGSAKPSQFVIVVAPDRKVFAVWNPDGIDPEFIPDDQIDSTAYKKRVTGDKLPGFTTACTAIPLVANIDVLCQPNQASQPLSISPSTFITVQAGTTLQFGGVDKEGWALLDKLSKEFANWPRYAAAPTSTSAAQT